MRSIVYIGMDVHQDFIEVAGIGEQSSEKIFSFRVSNNRESIRREFKKLKALYQLSCCYESSSCGYVVYRWLRDMRIACDIIAPSLIPQRPGDRVKTDRRDALKLALLYRSGVLTRVYIPDERFERARALVRCRQALNQDVVRSRHRVLKFLQVRGLVYRGGRNWTLKHWGYIRSLTFEGTDEIVFNEYISQLEYNISRVKELDSRIELLAGEQEYGAAIRTLCCLRGIGTLTAMVILTETIDFKRFAKAGQLMSYYGLISSQSSSGNSVRMGQITKAGNTRCRLALIESAWHYRHKPAIGSRLKGALKEQPAEVAVISWKAQQRLYKKYWGIANRKDSNKAVVAVARELVGFIWAMMQR
jgi:transposase